DRQSQYDIWRPNFISDAQFFRGATCIYVGEIGPSLIAAFETIEPPLQVEYRENGVVLAEWSIRVCRGFRGFPPRPGPPKY
ncbi:MAG: hypothetical protein ACRCZF_06440, partial [Gemmataceae bacterium]